MNYGIVKPVLIAFFISVLLSPMMIRYLHKLKFGQFIRGEGPESHLKKSGTPTMGGLIILLGIVIASLFYVRRYPMIIPVLFVTLGFGFIGFIDDYIKVVMKRNLGLRAWQKMFGQIIVTGIFAYYLINYTQTGTSMLIPFTHGKYLNLGVFFIPAVFIILLGTVNGANFTDGLDGLASSVTVLIATFFTVAAIGMGHNDLAAGIWPVSCATVGSLLGFLVFNVYPARVFMGDTGSLLLGGAIAGIAIYLKMPLLLLIIALVPILETLSVIIQVTYFKKTGNRIFKMAPLHHHFELSGWKENKIVSVFSLVTLICCALGLIII